MGHELVERLFREPVFQLLGVQQGFELVGQVFGFVGFAFGPDEAFDGGRHPLAAEVDGAAGFGAGLAEVFDGAALGVAFQPGVKGKGLAQAAAGAVEAVGEAGDFLAVLGGQAALVQVTGGDEEELGELPQQVCASPRPT